MNGLLRHGSKRKEIARALAKLIKAREVRQRAWEQDWLMLMNSGLTPFVTNEYIQK